MNGNLLTTRVRVGLINNLSRIKLLFTKEHLVVLLSVYNFSFLGSCVFVTNDLRFCFYFSLIFSVIALYLHIVADVFQEIRKYKISLIKKEDDLSKNLLAEFHRVHRLKQKQQFFRKVGAHFIREKNAGGAGHTTAVDSISEPHQKMHVDYLENPESES